MKKVDPKQLSFLQPGWFAFHALAIGGMVMLGRAISKRD